MILSWYPCEGEEADKDFSGRGESVLPAFPAFLRNNKTRHIRAAIKIR